MQYNIIALSKNKTKTNTSILIEEFKDREYDQREVHEMSGIQTNALRDGNTICYLIIR